jgi:hypothetical protein
MPPTGDYHLARRVRSSRGFYGHIQHRRPCTPPNWRGNCAMRYQAVVALPPLMEWLLRSRKRRLCDVKRERRLLGRCRDGAIFTIVHACILDIIRNSDIIERTKPQTNQGLLTRGGRGALLSATHRPSPRAPCLHRFGSGSV